MTLVMYQLLDSKMTEIEKEKGKDHEPIETQEEDTLVLWDCVSMLTWKMKSSVTKKKQQRLM